MLLHILLWRLKRPNRHALSLLFIFIIIPGVFLASVGMLSENISWTEVCGIFLLHASLSFAYIQVYPASQADSPSFKILLHVGKSMPQGMTAGEIQALFPAAVLLDARIEDLVRATLVSEKDGKLSLTKQGELLIRPFIYLRQILGLPAGEG